MLTQELFNFILYMQLILKYCFRERSGLINDDIDINFN